VITLSVVSHAQAGLAGRLLGDIASLGRADLQVILTVNVPEALPAGIGAEVIHNSRARGFGANHNAAFGHARGEYFCVMNPDIRLPRDPFPALLEALAHPAVGVAAPQVVDARGRTEDSVRRFPSTGSLFRKLLGARPGPDYDLDAGPIPVDWVGGMFMLFRREAFERVRGFDERYFLYYEDVDICRRLHGAGFRVIATPRAQAIHEAQRASRRNPRYMAMHARSMLRYLTTTYRP
jgi:N-acetylglucosaminyl-diphospho-decaprenol L-rhamnosyltransferase